MGPHLAIPIFVLVKFWRLILGLDIYELSDLIIFHDNHKHFGEKIFCKCTRFQLFSKPEPL